MLECLIWKAAIWDLFHGASKAVSRVKMKLNRLPRPSAARSSLKGWWTQPSDFSMRSTWPQKQLLVLWVKTRKGHVIGIYGGNNTQCFPMKQGILTSGRVCLLLSKGRFCYRARRIGKRKHKFLGCTVDANLSALNLFIRERKREREEDSWRNR